MSLDPASSAGAAPAVHLFTRVILRFLLLDEFKGHSLLQAAREADVAKVKKTLALEIISFKHPQTNDAALVRTAQNTTVTVGRKTSAAAPPSDDNALVPGVFDRRRNGPKCVCVDQISIFSKCDGALLLRLYWLRPESASLACVCGLD